MYGRVLDVHVNIGQSTFYPRVICILHHHVKPEVYLFTKLSEKDTRENKNEFQVL